jgi:hypothetical protein
MVSDVFVFPTSFAQQRLWFLEQFLGGRPSYNMPVIVRVTAPVNLDVLGRSVDEVVRRHESLRTTFDALDGAPVQVISPELHVPLGTIDLRGRPAGERDREAASRHRRGRTAVQPAPWPAAERRFFRRWFFAFCDEILWAPHAASA